MSATPLRILWLVYILGLVLIVYPFLPGGYDPLANALASFVQMASGPWLLTCIPAAIWLYQTLRYRRAEAGTILPPTFWRYPAAYAWTCMGLSLPLLLLLTFGMSWLAGILGWLGLGLVAAYLLPRLRRPGPDVITPLLPLSLMCLPIVWLTAQLTLAGPLTTWSRTRAIHHAREMIDEIERFKAGNGHYPITLNGLHPDYTAGICGISRYHYTYDSATYHVYFEQPRFFYDQIGTREVVVYNRDEQHFMMSHTSWHMLLPPDERRSTQGWYAAHDAGVAHWKYCWFD